VATQYQVTQAATVMASEATRRNIANIRCFSPPV
jgi:hypothetical protein